jgi:hypothetical protein
MKSLSTMSGNASILTKNVIGINQKMNLDVSGTNFSMKIYPYDMGALTLNGSSGALIRLGIADVGPGGIKTNVDWVCEIIELDEAKLLWVGQEILFNPDSLDNVIKQGGFRKKVVIKGEVASGLLGFAIDPLGKICESISGSLFPEEGITINREGVYAIIAYSGSPWGDSNELRTLWGSAWQRGLWVDALTLNILLGGLDTVGVAGKFIGVDISPLLNATYLQIRSGISNANPQDIGKEFVTIKLKEAISALAKDLRPYLFSSLSDLQHQGVKKWLEAGVGAVGTVMGVFSGTIRTGTRIGNLICNVTPRESAHIIVSATSSPIPQPPTLVIDGGLSSTKQIGQTFNLTGSGYTPNRTVTRYLRQPDGSEIVLTPTLTADSGGNISWSFAPTCSTPAAINTMRVYDDATGRYSNWVTETITPNPSCN